MIRDAARWVLLAAALAWAALIVGWRPSVLTLTVDDSFYYLVTARNCAHGAGFSFDQIHTTNGFHPLWMWLLVPLAWLAGGDMDTFTRVILVVQVALVFGATDALLRGVSPRAGPRGAVAVLSLTCGFYLMKALVNGMESALFYALLVTLLRRTARLHDRARTPRASELGVLAAVAAALTLARLTAISYAVPALLLAATRFKRRWGVLAACALVFALPVVAYGGANLVEFGHVLPVSAAIKAARSDAAPTDRILAATASGALVVVLAFAVWRRRPHAGVPRPSELPTFLLLAGLFVESVVHGAVRGWEPPEIWTLVPHATLLLLLAADPPDLVGRSGRRVALALTIAFSAFQWGWRLRPLSYTPYVEARRAGEWLRDNTEADAIIAGWSCGITAAFSSRRLINLDGLINSWDYKTRVLDQGTEARYLDESRVDYVVEPFDLDAVPLLGEEPWGQWPVVYARCYVFRPALSRAPRRLVELVFARTGVGMSLRDHDAAGDLCHAAGGSP